ncbi:helix-turn-helix domain-containing protein [Companilactobacillus nantensis]|uniref:HTH cro/C1-type domain-containing protein n=1 Tax=Companilactobacillus nantensis DSM 16982 TaxID=1423774 RepID=A0A0R1WTI9_9LACO|nr:helix-turn-helix transcriptional regulator [Companilactobacillus nantensis]KRM18435.1 hypothetical protein FD31_GL000981 [Companilactobacillus nantensis DSM 16982]GEO63004.1 hypothetical protein LNA01_01870 [Companilactobacillus nantensis]
MPNKVTNKEFGNMLKKLREEHHYSLRQVSYQSKTDTQPAVSPSYWSLIERGERNIPKQETLKRMAKGLKVPAKTILKMAGYTEIIEDDEKNNYYDLSGKEKLDLGKLADKLLDGSDTDAESDYYGEPSTPEQKANLRSAILTALEINKRQAKKKFTPKKYRNDDENK